jgi:hypothetical protein
LFSVTAGAASLKQAPLVVKKRCAAPAASVVPAGTLRQVVAPLRTV